MSLKKDLKNLNLSNIFEKSQSTIKDIINDIKEVFAISTSTTPEEKNTPEPTPKPKAQETTVLNYSLSEKIIITKLKLDNNKLIKIPNSTKIFEVTEDENFSIILGRANSDNKKYLDASNKYIITEYQEDKNLSKNELTISYGNLDLVLTSHENHYFHKFILENDVPKIIFDEKLTTCQINPSRTIYITIKPGINRYFFSIEYIDNQRRRTCD